MGYDCVILSVLESECFVYDYYFFESDCFVYYYYFLESDCFEYDY